MLPLNQSILVVSIYSAAAALFAQTLALRDSRYHLQPSDVIEVQYRHTPEYNQVVTVPPDGFASLNLIGSIKIAGSTVDELATAIAARAAARLNDPEVMVVLKEFERPYFVVAGEVAKPGRFDMHGNMTVVQAIAISGGFNANSQRSQVLLVRKVGADIGEVKEINVKQLMRKSGAAEDTMLQSGDLLVVPQNKISRVERFVKWGSAGIYWSPVKH